MMFTAVFLSLLTSAAYAKNYKIEVIVFENLSASQAPQNFEYQNLEELPNPDKLWPIKPTMLLDSAKDIKNSAKYRVLHHLSWGQKALPLSQSASFNVTEENVSGRIKVYAGQLLFANLNLNFNGYQINEKRRIKLNERHFYDHPKFGVLMQVSRLE